MTLSLYHGVCTVQVSLKTSTKHALSLSLLIVFAVMLLSTQNFAVSVCSGAMLLYKRRIDDSDKDNGNRPFRKLDLEGIGGGFTRQCLIMPH